MATKINKTLSRTRKAPVTRKKTSPDQSSSAGNGAGHKETIGDTIVTYTAPHPIRSDSPEYIASRKWLVGNVPGGCYICGGPVDLSHPGSPANSRTLQLQDHHGGGLYHGTVLIGFSLFPLEWSMGFGADPKKIQLFVQQLIAAGLVEYDKPINTTDDVMAWVDSTFNANVKLCKPHHIGHQTDHTPDVNGHEAVGIHNAPWPILAAQATCDWERFDMWAGTTGTIAVAPDPRVKGGTIVTYVHESHPVKLQVNDRLPPSHPHSRTAYAGYPKR